MSLEIVEAEISKRKLIMLTDPHDMNGRTVAKAIDTDEGVFIFFTDNTLTRIKAQSCLGQPGVAIAEELPDSAQVERVLGWLPE